MPSPKDAPSVNLHEREERKKGKKFVLFRTGARKGKRQGRWGGVFQRLCHSFIKKCQNERCRNRVRKTTLKYETGEVGEGMVKIVKCEEGSRSVGEMDGVQ